MRPTKKQEIMGPHTGKKHSAETVPEGPWTLNLPNEDSKSAIINVFKEQKKIVSKELLGIMRISSHRAENINKEIEIIEREENTNSRVDSIIGNYNN